eukprot:2319848-Rhodomonas_salina.1
MIQVLSCVLSFFHISSRWRGGTEGVLYQEFLVPPRDLGTMSETFCSSKTMARKSGVKMLEIVLAGSRSAIHREHFPPHNHTCAVCCSQPKFVLEIHWGGWEQHQNFPNEILPDCRIPGGIWQDSYTVTFALRARCRHQE